jgi:outer membrane translocation and assembly module TamA
MRGRVAASPLFFYFNSELPARGIDIQSAAAAHRRFDSPVAKPVRERLDALAAGRGEIRRTARMQRKDIHQRTQSARHPRQPVSVGITVVDAADHDVLESHSFAENFRGPEH